MTRLKIVSDGSPDGTRVLNVETGEQLTNVKSISWRIDQDDLCATATLELVNVEVDVEGVVEEER